MSVETALQALRLEPRFMRNITRWEIMPARAAQYAPFPPDLDPRLVAALAARGVTAPYTHQAEAIAAALLGQHTAIVTPAASGKTLCYNLPVLNRLLANPDGRALYLFPTKALAQDQLAELHELTGLLNGERETSRQVDRGGKRLQALGSSFSPLLLSPERAPRLTCATYDGDTPSAQRAKARDAARIILSNPDMLHTGILPQHPRWAVFFANLRVVVIDEMHVYRGVFGSHVANVLRRLRRIARFYGSDPQFVLASATIANPAELAERLVESPVTLISPERDGAPQSEKHVLFYNPPLIDVDLGLRRSSSLEASDLATQFLAHDVQTIVFARARLTMELILTYLRENRAAAPTTESAQSEPRSSATGHKPSAIRGYRGGYLPSERREIEKGLREGTVRGVVTTSALELGIDIGRLDAAVLAGYPGTVASARQQIGRAGRRQGSSVGVLVAGAGAMDQYILTHPEWLLARSPEHARINPDNAVILAHHLACAAAEMPIERTDRFLTSASGAIADLLDDLVEASQLYRSGSRYYWAGDGSPANGLSLRTAGPESVIIQTVGEQGKPQVIGELERESAPIMLYEGAIYLHEGQTYLVEQTDWEGGIARVRPTEVDFYTRPISSEKIEVLATKDERRITKDDAVQPSASSFQSAWGDVRVTSQTTGYKIIRRTSQEVLGFGKVDLPEQMLETQACWLVFTKDLIERLKAAGAWYSDPNEYGANWPAQRDATRSRDGYHCQGCGTVEMPGLQHDVHHRIPFRAFLADPTLRGGLAQECAWQAANVLENLITLCPACHRQAEAGVRIRSGLGGAATLLAGIAPIFLMCDPRDLGLLAEPQDATSGLPTITLYERVPGGVGYAEQLYESMPDLLRAAYDLVMNCTCERGCPACVGPVLEHEYALDTKSLATALLRELCDS